MRKGISGILAGLLLVSVIITGCAYNKPIDINQTAVIKGSEKKKVIEDIRGTIEYIQKGNGYFKVINGKDTSETYVYNSNGEALAQGNQNHYMTIFRKDGTSVRFTDKVSTGPDVDILTLMEYAIKLVESGDANIEKAVKPIESEKDFYVNYVSIKGWDNIHKLYAQVNKEFADLVIDNMKKSVQEDTEIELRFKFILGNNKEFSAGSEIILKDKKYTLWYMDGYLLLYDWKLSDDWYSLKNDDKAKPDEMLKKLLGEMDTMFKKYAEDNNIKIGEEIVEGGKQGNRVEGEKPSEAPKK